MNCYPFKNKKCEIFSDNRKIINVEENKRKYIAQNQSENNVCLAHIDSCLINDEGVKCDFLLLNWNKKKCYFIELKGADLIHAIEQIDRSIDLLLPNITDFDVNARIVLTKVYAPDLKSNKFKRLELKLKKLNGDIIKKEKVLNEEI